MKWVAFGLLALAVVALWRFWPQSHGPTVQDIRTDSLIASHERFKREVLAELEAAQHERDSVLRLSDKRGDSIRVLSRKQKLLHDSLTDLIGSYTTPVDSAKCNLALSLSLREGKLLRDERDVCATDRTSLRHQLVQDSTQHRQDIAHMIFRTDSLQDALWYEKNKPHGWHLKVDGAKPLVITNVISVVLTFILSH